MMMIRKKSFMLSDEVDGGDGQKKQLVNPHVELREFYIIT